MATFFNSLCGHWSIWVFLTPLESILVIYIFIRKSLISSRFSNVLAKIEQAFPHDVHQNESQWHNAMGNSMQAILWGTKPKVFQAAALSWFG